MLYIVPTPIGNLKDITLRSIEVLQQVEVILCEDTRTSGKLLSHYGIQKPTMSYHMHNEHKVVDRLVDQLLAGKSMALITDAGTPGISDPAFLLVRACAKAGIRVETLPGATAFVPALVNSGIPCNRFCFEGFLPLKKGRQTLMKQLAEETRTMVFYESPMRLVKTLKEMALYFGAERCCSVTRELTKLYEETMRGTLQEVHDYYEKTGVKGEIVLIVQGKA
ncbi:16S rRNA (cytidine(1402)-2'-O)-methyltransferase [Arachidicoccus ginsenosidivorans]|jgi:16S rRNA (cytidine1402-2'-O)-methyltransferase|uniref:Ribosomal RNA small subunit methyltransferase I n=1 Tax=Arachidicoccus ginsenosidivorans TaxID=496057 RepID=A0A5B8VK96_9BACT|nr:16S rRNA (cytidine(1402)-2'-O)-methyltransferase [Arachidicoccus ginsenosidivorans]QEC71392.1 16S rRNA (cytidine(1402)-2'-O)-methyltransferase [Arachidicoccus ginsenosidivorans]